ncbi:MAG: GcrA family cell cycle regulator [Deltaproteobacteria bacterium]|nr:GcrA family cell cycle regulator [Deltaproteobacteria bacterium]
MSGPWSEDLTAEVAHLWADGHSAGEIETMLPAGHGRTRNAIIGKMSRLQRAGGHPKREQGPPRATRPRLTSAGRSAASRAGNGTFGRPPVLKAVPVPRARTDIPEPVSLGLTLMQLTKFTCHWPGGGPSEPPGLFCGHATFRGGPYCEGHTARAFHPPKQRDRAGFYQRAGR